MTRKRIILTIYILVVGLLSTTSFVSAQSPSVFAVLFYSPSCGHCQKVIQEDLPPLLEQYGDQVSILAINVSAPVGQQLYQDAVQQFKIPDERIGVPCLIVGDTVLVGSGEIPEVFPQIIDQGLSAGGISWPNIPGLQEIIPPAQSSTIDNDTNPESIDTISDQPVSDLVEENLRIEQRFRQDLIGNTVAVFVLLGMAGSLIGFGYRVFNAPVKETTIWPAWVIPALAVVGIIIAGYLSYVEITHTEAVCGPVGDCNVVQQSPYARLFNLLPIGVLGVLGYLMILFCWTLSQYGPIRWRRLTTYCAFILSLSGVIFSFYLTFLEPFVIGATCAWCIASAIIITLIFWAATGEIGELHRAKEISTL